MRPTIGTLSGLVTMRRKFGSNVPKMKNTPRSPRPPYPTRFDATFSRCHSTTNERRDHEQEKQPRVGDGVDDALDEIHKFI